MIVSVKSLPSSLLRNYYVGFGGALSDYLDNGCEGNYLPKDFPRGVPVRTFNFSFVLVN